MCFQTINTQLHSGGLYNVRGSNNFILYNDVTMFGDYNTISVNTIDECKANCIQDSNCHSFSFDVLEPSSCYTFNNEEYGYKKYIGWKVYSLYDLAISNYTFTRGNIFNYFVLFENSNYNLFKMLQELQSIIMLNLIKPFIYHIMLNQQMIVGSIVRIT